MSDQRGSPGVLRTLAMTAVLAGAAGSVALELRVGRHNSSAILMVMFAVWVVFPFVGLALADSVSRLWPARSRTMLHVAMLAIALATLAIYALVALGPARAKPASFFLLVPVASWVMLALVAGIAARRPGG